MEQHLVKLPARAQHPRQDIRIRKAVPDGGVPNLDLGDGVRSQKLAQRQKWSTARAKFECWKVM
jgi:hypothetical protein